MFGVPLVVVGSLHVTEFFVEPPARLPDLFTVLISVISCAVFGLLYLYLAFRLVSPFFQKQARVAVDDKAGHKE